MLTKDKKTYEVVFAVKGFLNDPEGNIGKTECNGLYKMGNKFHLRNGRISYHIEDQDFHNAYMTAKKRLKEENFGGLTVETTFLIHVFDGHTYWHAEDLNDIAKAMAEYIHKNIHCCPFPDDVTDFNTDCTGFNSEECVNCMIKRICKAKSPQIKN